VLAKHNHTVTTTCSVTNAEHVLSQQQSKALCHCCGSHAGAAPGSCTRCSWLVCAATPSLKRLQGAAASKGRLCHLAQAYRTKHLEHTNMLAQKCHPADSKPLYFKQCCKGCLLLLPAILPTSQHLLSAAGCNAACNITCEWASRSLNPPSHTIQGSKPAHLVDASVRHAEYYPCLRASSKP
jgi:hypothetical protein